MQMLTNMVLYCDNFIMGKEYIGNNPYVLFSIDMSCILKISCNN